MDVFVNDPQVVHAYQRLEKLVYQVQRLHLADGVVPSNPDTLQRLELRIVLGQKHDGDVRPDQAKESHDVRRAVSQAAPVHRLVHFKVFKFNLRKDSCENYVLGRLSGKQFMMDVIRVSTFSSCH